MYIYIHLWNKSLVIPIIAHCEFSDVNNSELYNASGRIHSVCKEKAFGKAGQLYIHIILQYSLLLRLIHN